MAVRDGGGTARDGERGDTGSHARGHEEVDLAGGHIEQRSGGRGSGGILDGDRDASERNRQRLRFGFLRGGCQVGAENGSERLRRHYGNTRRRRLHHDGLLEAVVARHPVRQDVVDSGGLDDAGSSDGELEGASLPQEIGGRAQPHGHRLAGLVAADRNDAAEVHAEIPPQTQQPAVQQGEGLAVARRVRAVQGKVDDVEEGILVRRGMVPQQGVCGLIDGFRGAGFQADQVVEVDVVQIEFEIRAVAGGIDADGSGHGGREQNTLGFVADAREVVGVDMPADRQKGLDLVGADEKRRAAAAVRHDDRPVVAVQKVDEARDQVADGAFDRGVGDHVVGHGQAEQCAAVFVARRVADPDPAGRAVGVDAVGNLLAANPGRVGRIDGHHAAGQKVGSGDIGQAFEAGNRRLQVVQGVGRLGDFVTESLGGQIVAGPERRIAAARVAGDLVAIGEREDRVENRAER